ncbi:hypothetical protein [Sphingomonas sp.]|jgi:hypothetical protein|uniref:hypothetical protein n=1 Tax=Sphingomonas sp. TaxID=28214 RepID=UPI002DEEF8D5|nr:hypothetical protein [Sphingomonas sp.]
MSDFWRKWVVIWCLAIGLFGVVLTLAAVPGNDSMLVALLSQFGPAPQSIDAPLQFATGLMGAVTMGWAATLYMAFRAAELLPADEAGRFWHGILGGVVLWYVVDCSLSVATRFGLNVVPNTLFLIAFLLPLWAAGVLKPQRLSTAS